jgi:hypothetical protein
VFGVATSVLSLLLGSLHGGDAGHALPSDHGAGALYRLGLDGKLGDRLFAD